MGQSRCLKEVDHAITKFRNPRQHVNGTTNVHLLKLHFLNCIITENDVKEMSHRMAQEFLLLGAPPMHLAFPCSKLEGPTAVTALEQFVTTHKIQSLSFSVANLTQEEMRRIISASKHSLQTLHLTIRYKESVQPLIQELCLPDKGLSSEETKEEALLPPLQELVFDARQPMESRIRIPRMQELAEALPGLQDRLRSFELTTCDFDDEGFAILVGGLLQLRSSLEWLHLQNVKGDITPKSLVFVSYLMVELPKLSWLHLEMKNSKRKLFANATDDQVKGLTNAMQQCTAGLRLELANVGMTQATVSKLLEAGAATVCSNLILSVEDSNFISNSDKFVKTVVEHLPDMKRCTQLSLVDTSSTWRSRNDHLIVDALERNQALERMELRVGDWDWNDRHSDRVPLILQRNCDIARVEQGLHNASCCVSDELWPDALASINKSSTSLSSSPTFLAVKGRFRYWLSACNPLQDSAIVSNDDEKKLPADVHFDVAVKENNDEDIRRRTHRHKSDDSLLRQQRLEDALNNFESSSSSSSEDSDTGWDTSSYSGSDDSEDIDNDSIISSSSDLPPLVPISQTDDTARIEDSEDSAKVSKKKKRKKSSSKKKKKNETYEERKERKAKEKKSRKKAAKRKAKETDESGKAVEGGTDTKKKKKKKKSKKKTKRPSLLAKIVEEEESEHGVETENETIELEVVEPSKSDSNDKPVETTHKGDTPDEKKKTVSFELGGSDEGKSKTKSKKTSASSTSKTKASSSKSKDANAKGTKSRKSKKTAETSARKKDNIKSKPKAKGTRIETEKNKDKTPKPKDQKKPATVGGEKEPKEQTNESGADNTRQMPFKCGV